MNDTPTPPEASGDVPEPALAPDSAPLAQEAPKRPWTILGRLTQAVREQNWFAVALELAIVVLGVVIGFQVTSWGQSRADRAQEQVYLRQLAADLHETRRLVERADSIHTANGSDRAAANAIQMYYLPQPPPRDSVIEWLVRPSWIEVVTPLLGTADALISSGDLGLVRDDSHRGRTGAVGR